MLRSHTAEIPGLAPSAGSEVAQLPVVGMPAARSSTRARAARVVFVNRYFFPDLSATSQMLSDLAFRLAQQGIEVHVVCSDRLYDEPGRGLPAEETIRGVHVHRARTTNFDRGPLLGRAVDYASFYVTATTKLFALLRRGDTVVSKTDPPLISIAAAAIAKVRGARLVNWLQDVFPEVASHLGANPLPYWLDEQLKRLRDYSLSMAQTNVVLGTRMQEHLEGRHIPSDRIRIIENWADEDAVVPKSIDSSELRTQLGIDDKFVVGYSGNLGRAHEFDTLLAAAERLRDDAGIVFLMIGGGAKMEQLRAAVTAKELTNFRFLAYQPRHRLSDSLAAADVHLACLLPQLEGLIVPSKFYGILAAGRPTVFIGDPDGELARIITSNRCGFAVPMGASDALVDVIQQLAVDKAGRDCMGESARALFIEKYTVGRAARQWMEALQA
jgi:colanic acid biosynthesis glycosyl transferase WcaI